MANFTIVSADDTANSNSIGTQIGSSGDYQGTLREAINFANVNANNPSASTTISVADGLSSSTVMLQSNLPLVATSIQFNGGDAAGNMLTINGGGRFRGFLITGIASNGTDAAPTTVGISNVQFVQTAALGGAGGTRGGGGGLGAGGAIFVGPAANVTLTNVDISRATAVGGAGGVTGRDSGFGLGGGGGLSGAGGAGGQITYGGGGGILFPGSPRGGGGGITGAGAGTSGGAGLGSSKGGGSYGATPNNGGKGDLGGGGGGSSGGTSDAGTNGGAGGFGAGGGASRNLGGGGGFGGGGGAGFTGYGSSQGGFGGGGGFSIGSGSVAMQTGNGGFAAGGGAVFGGRRSTQGGSGGGEGGTRGGNGGSGASLGGAIFVTDGGSLTIAGSTTEANSSVTSVGSSNGGGGGAAHGDGIFFQGTRTGSTFLRFSDGNQSFASEITDYVGSGGTNPANGTRANDTGGSVTLVKSGEGTLTLSGANTYTGGTLITDGIVAVANTAAGGNAALGQRAVTLNGGSLQDGVGTTTIANAIVAGQNNGTVIGGATGTTFTLAGPITGSGNLTFTSTGGTIGVAQDSHSGTTELSGSVTLAGVAANALSNTSTYLINNGTTLALNYDQRISRLADGVNGSGQITSGARSATLTVTNTDNISFSGSLVDGNVSNNNRLALVQQGSAKLTLSGNNTFSGGLTINSGAVAVASDANLGASGTFIRLDGGTLETTVDGFTSNRILFIGAGSFRPSNSVGVVQVDTGTTTLSGSITDSAAAAGNQTGTLVKTGSGTLSLASGNTYNGGTDIRSGTLSLTLDNSAGSGAISFNSLSGSASAQLVLERGAQVTNGTFTNTLNDFGDNEALVLRGFAFSGTQSYTVSNGTLTVQNAGGQSQSFRLTNANEPAETTYFARSDGQGGTIISSDLVCYAQGTRIRTMGGEVAVEALRVGDLVVTGSDALRPIRWIGHRTVACRRHPQGSLVLPVRIAAGAFGPGRPARDLTVSPAHAICVEVEGREVLIPAVRLINGTTVARIEVERVTYWHVELDSHDIILAEGLPAESYLDCGNRSFFANAAVTSLRAVPDEVPDGALPFCRPFHEAGLVVEAVRAHLEQRAQALGWSLDAAPSLGLHLLADGRVIHPEMDGMSANFVMPAGTCDVRLVSNTSVPAHVVGGSSDDRRLGVSIRSLVLDDGVSGARDIALNDLRLSQGFHLVDRDASGSLWRWTDGSARLPASLWAGCRGAIRVQIALAGMALPRWIDPSSKAEVEAMGGLRQRA